MPAGNEISLGEAINRFIHKNQLEKKLGEQKLLADFRELVGEYISSKAKDIFIKNDKLYIKTESSVIRQELSFMRARLLHVINRKFGEGLIKEIVVL
jgi:predicted nucleic acid-binding Zn ribbon protein